MTKIGIVQNLRQGTNMEPGQFEGGAFLHDPRHIVALINLTLFGLVSLGLIAYSIIDGDAHFFPLIVLAVWCLYIQFLARKKKPARARWLVRQQRQETAMGVFSVLVTLSLIIGPILDAIAALT
jgi:archaellum biogenesis protein FlaJ (TadC family)